ncbi:hypothetical protein ACFUMH_12065 [Cellulomonas sp. NPDC057328]|uniref:hypothetical protein n=1 Tax=Cellulomonas sp. NPDC057328 TaxID=3346101 RepID=UPI003636AB64
MTSPDPAAVPRTAPDLGVPSRAWLLAVLTVLVAATTSSGVLPSARGAGPALSALAVVLLVGLAAALLLRAPAAGVPGVPGPRQVLVATVAAAGLAVPALLTTGGLAVVLTGAALVATLTALPLAAVHVAARPGGGRQAATGLLLGAGLWTVLGAGLRGASGPGGPGSDPGGLPPGPALAAVVLALSAVAAAVGLGRADALTDDPPAGRPRRTWVVGPAVLVLDLVLADAAHVATVAGVPEAVAGLVLVLATSVGVWLLLRPDPWSPAARVVAAAVVLLGVVAVPALTGPAVLVAAAAALVAAGMVLASALSAHRPAPPGVPRTALATAAVAAAVLSPWLLVALDPSGGTALVLLVPCAAAALAGAGLRRRTPDPVGGAAAPAPASAPVRIPPRVNSVRLLLLPALVLALAHVAVAGGEPPPAGTYVVLP